MGARRDQVGTAVRIQPQALTASGKVAINERRHRPNRLRFVLARANGRSCRPTETQTCGLFTWYFTPRFGICREISRRGRPPSVPLPDNPFGNEFGSELTQEMERTGNLDYAARPFATQHTNAFGGRTGRRP